MKYLLCAVFAHLVAPTMGLASSLLVSVAQPQANAFINSSNVSSFSVSGSCTLSGGSVSYYFQDSAGNVVYKKIANACVSNGFQFAGVDLSSLIDGSITLKVGLYDDATLNSNTQTLMLRKDTLAPSLSVAQPLANATLYSSASSNFSISGTCSEAGDAISYYFRDSAGKVVYKNIAGACVSNAFKISGIDLSALANGQITLKVGIYDAAQNSRTQTINIQKVAPVSDTGPPTVLESPTSGFVFAPSAVYYSGASATKPFTPSDPYYLQVLGVSTLSTLWGSPRTFDFSGNVPFINPVTGVADPGIMQGWDPITNSSINITGSKMTNAGFPGRVDKTYGYTMVRYNANDGVTDLKCRTELIGYSIPPRTHVKWEFAVAFGANDSENQWALTPSGASPVAFWQTKSAAIGNPSMLAEVDTDPNDPTALMISFAQRGGTSSTSPVPVGNIHGIKPNTMNYITVEAFLDERETSNGGLGLERAWVNGHLVVDKQGPTLGSVPDNPTAPSNDLSYNWSIDMYLYHEALPYPHTRASFWKTARMFVYPQGQ